MERFYDIDQNRLIYVGKAATEQFWDEHWQTDDFQRVAKAKPNSWVVKISERYLPKGSRILEGGCGSANHVYALHKRGFEIIGLDYAPKTVSLLNETVPELDIRLGDVRDLPFEDQFFDGYWSLGVIEHFWDGYNNIAEEIKRVLRPKGILFLTFPAMTDIRIWKVKTGKYALWQDGNQKPEDFYQFALSPERTEAFFTELGFTLEFKQGWDGLKGFKDEIPQIHSPLQKLYDSHNLFARVLKKIFNESFSNWLGHSCLLILRKQ